MIKHIVMWRLKDHALGRSKMENGHLIKDKLEALNGRIPGLIKLEVGLNFVVDETACDVVLYSEFNSREDLNHYQTHPEHIAVASVIMDLRVERRVADYEI